MARCNPHSLSYRLPNLWVLDVSRTGVTDAGIMRLKGLANLEHLEIDGTNITETGIANVKMALPKLTVTRKSREQ